MAAGCRDISAGSLKTPQSSGILGSGLSRLPLRVPQTYRQPVRLLELGERQTRVSWCNSSGAEERSRELAVFFRWKLDSEQRSRTVPGEWDYRISRSATMTYLRNSSGSPPLGFSP